MWCTEGVPRGRNNSSTNRRASTKYPDGTPTNCRQASRPNLVRNWGINDSIPVRSIGEAQSQFGDANPALRTENRSVAVPTKCLPAGVRRPWYVAAHAKALEILDYAASVSESRWVSGRAERPTARPCPCWEDWLPLGLSASLTRPAIPRASADHTAVRLRHHDHPAPDREDRGHRRGRARSHHRWSRADRIVGAAVGLTACFALFAFIVNRVRRAPGMSFGAAGRLTADFVDLRAVAANGLALRGPLGRFSIGAF
jgi:hypothetical protein